MKIFVIGATGQLGSDIVRVIDKDVIGLSHKDLDVTNISACRDVLEEDSIVINCAAYTNVDECEAKPKEAFMVNTIGAKNITLVCREKGIKNVYISTDFVFDGNSSSPYKEEDIPNPINIYGVTKFMGEIFTRNYCQKSYIIRTSSLYGIKGSRGKGGNFVDWIIEKVNNKEEIKVVEDITMSPTYTKDLAYAIKILIEADYPYGIYHFANKGFCSWSKFAKKIFEFLKINSKIIPISYTELRRETKRPKFTALNSDKISSLRVKTRAWDVALKEYLIEKEYLG